MREFVDIGRWKPQTYIGSRHFEFTTCWKQYLDQIDVCCFGRPDALLKKMPRDGSPRGSRASSRRGSAKGATALGLYGTPPTDVSPPSQRVLFSQLAPSVASYSDRSADSCPRATLGLEAVTASASGTTTIYILHCLFVDD